MSRALGNYSYVACKIYGGPRRRLLTARRAPLLALPFSLTAKRNTTKKVFWCEQGKLSMLYKH
jgi:hypothetical protein